MGRFALFAALIASLWLPTAARAEPTSKPSDQQIAEIIVRESRQAYCGKRSAYSRPAGAEPYCYVTDVPAAEIARYRAAH